MNWSLRVFPFFLCLTLFFGCSDAKPVRKKLPVAKPEELEDAFHLDLTGKHELHVLAEWKMEVDSTWKMQIHIDAEHMKSRDTTFTKPNQAALLKPLLNYVHRVPYDKSLNANFKYVKGKFEQLDPVAGSQIDTVKLRIRLQEITKPGTTTLNLEEAGMYILPQYDHQSERTAQGKVKLNTCLKSKITLKAPRAEAVLDHKVFGPWLSLDDSMEVKVDMLAVQKFMEALAVKVEVPLSEILATYPLYDTTYAGEEPAFNRLSITNEMQALAELILKGKVVTRDLVFKDIGIPQGIKTGLKDFVEVSIDQQKLWLFKAGNLLLETNVVTGNRSLGRSTPKGTYAIRAKAQNVVLRGDDYATPVSYWMPFHNGYGLHDANWRRKFGSTIYISNGSHGCVNMPTKLTPFVYANVEVGTPVIIR